MATAIPTVPRRHARDLDGFGGLVPGRTVARGGDTLVALLGVEHHADGAALPIMILSEAPGLLAWDAPGTITCRDDVGGRYEVDVLTENHGLGQLTATLWIGPAVPAEARRLELTIAELSRVNPARGGAEGIARPLSGGPWTLGVDLVPERTVAEPPEPPAERRRPTQPGSVPARSISAFVDLVPVGQARMAGDIAVCITAIERYWDRWILTISALGESGSEVPPPAVGRAQVSVWDDRGHRYRATPIQGSAEGAWSEVAVEVVPALDEDARAVAVTVDRIPRGAESTSRYVPAGPFTFGIRVSV